MFTLSLFYYLDRVIFFRQLSYGPGKLQWQIFENASIYWNTGFIK